MYNLQKSWINYLKLTLYDKSAATSIPKKKKKEFLENNSGSGILLEDAKEIIASFF